jgi:PAS domain S-box-containing protein
MSLFKGPHKGKLFLLTFLSFFLIGSTLLGISLKFIYTTDINIQRIRIEGKEHDDINLQKSVIITHFYGIISDLAIISELHELKQFADHLQDYSSRELEHDFLSIASRKTIYDQIRFIDKTGMEIIRVNYNAGKPEVVHQNNLQNKGHRYYFAQTVNLNSGQVYISRLDLNMENKKVERPFQPVIRFGMPLLNSQNQKQGALILNYNANKLLSDFKNITKNSSGKNWLLNKQGYWLAGSNTGEEWGFMFKEKHHITLKEKAPVAWKILNEKVSGQFYHQDGLYTFDTFHPDMISYKQQLFDDSAHKTHVIDKKDNLWKIVSFIPKDILRARLQENSEYLKFVLTTIFFVLFLLNGFVAFIFAKFQRNKRLAEETIKQYNQNLERTVKERTRELRKLTHAVEQSDSTIVISDIDGNIEYINPAFTKVSGYSKKEAIGQNPRILQSNQHTPEFYGQMWDVISHGKTWRGEMINKKKNGDLFWEFATISPVKTSSGTTSHYVAIKEDITNRKLMELDLVKAKEEAEKANQTKSIFLANMSHEIRTPMNAILGFTKLLSESKIDDSQKRYVNTIHSSGKSLLSLINDILDLSKVEAGKLKLSYEACKLSSIFHDIEMMFSQKIADKGLKFIIDLDPKLPETIWIDTGRMKQILINLIGNAIKFTDKGFIKLIAQKKHRWQNRRSLDLILKIQDTGIGVPEDQICSIFGVFEQQANQPSKYGGTGLGLAITKNLVALMDGDITVNSDVGKGSIFQVHFPEVKLGLDTESEQKWGKSLPSYENKKAIDFSQNFKTEKLPELLDWMETKKDEWQILCKAMLIDGIKQFAQNFQKKGEMFDYPPIKEWGEDLEKQADQFQLDKLPKTLSLFSDHINKVKSIIEQHQEKAKKLF